MHPADLQDLRAQLIKKYTPVWQLNPQDVREEYFREVEATARDINDKMFTETICFGIRESLRCDLMMLISYLHGMFLWCGNNANTMVVEYLESTDDEFFSVISRTDMDIIKEACLGNIKNFRHGITEVMYSARVGRPKYLMSKILKEIEEYKLRGLSEDDIKVHLLHDLVELPELYRKVYEKEIEGIIDFISKLTIN